MSDRLAGQPKVHAREILGVRWTRARIAVLVGCLLIGLIVLSVAGVGVWRAGRAEKLYVELVGRGVVLMPRGPETQWNVVKLATVGQASSAITTGSIVDQSGVFQTPRDVERVLEFPALREIYLAKCPLSSELVEVLSRIPELRELGLGNSRAGNRELAALTRLSKLRTLQLMKSEIGDEGLAQLSRFSELHTLVLEPGKITGEGFAALGRLKKLMIVVIQGESFDDQCLQKLVAALEGNLQLQHLSLIRTKVTDEGLSCLVKLKEIAQLDFTEMQITEKGLMRLKEMKQLQSVSVEKCKVSAAGIKEFEKNVPKVNVTTELGEGAY